MARWAGAALLAAALTLIAATWVLAAEPAEPGAVSASPKWLDNFCIGSEQCMPGDFDGNGKDDVVAFYGDSRPLGEQDQVWVALSSGESFAAPQLWLTGFCTGQQVCKTGDFNDDGRDDIIAFDRAAGAVYIALAEFAGTGFQSPGGPYGGSFCTGQEICNVGDFNGDGNDDIIAFARGTTGDVHVARSLVPDMGTLPASPFASRTLWHDFFCIGTEECRVGNFNGDSREDIAAFRRGSDGRVFVGLAYTDQDRFGAPGSDQWSPYFCAGTETCDTGDFDGDGRDDAVTFLGGGYVDYPSTQGDVFVAFSKGTGFAEGQELSGGFCLANELCTTGDFDGDGRADSIRFVRDTQSGQGRGDVYVAVTAGALPQFVRTPAGVFGKWSDAFCRVGHVCGTGDFNGDGRDDIISFVRDAEAYPVQGDVYVQLSQGDQFGPLTQWHDNFCRGQEVCKVGDFNGDGRDDIAAFAQSAGVVWVALSNGSSMFSSGAIWNAVGFCASSSLGAEVCDVGDFNRDGRDDIVAFTRSVYTTYGVNGRVWVALSTGSSFQAGAIWRDSWFCVGQEQCGVGDFNGDYRDDIVAMTRSLYPSNPGQVFVALSAGSSFGASALWHDEFCKGQEICRVGDYNGDGRDDIASFYRNGYDTQSAGDVYVAAASGVRFVSGLKWNDNFCVGAEDCTVGDVNGDDAVDALYFVRNASSAEQDDVYVALSTKEHLYLRPLGHLYPNLGWLPSIGR